MSTEKTNAIVIRQADFSETSRVVTLFTEDHGKISVVAKGAKRLKGPFENSLDLLSLCKIVFIKKESQSLDILTEAQLQRRYRPQTADLRSLYGGYYVAELLNGLMEDYDPHPELFHSACSTLEAIAKEADPTITLMRFELAILDESGHLPSFDYCEKCGEPISYEAEFVFWVTQGGLLCHKCRHDTFKQNPIQPGTLAVLRRLADPSPEATKNLFITSHQTREIRHVLTASLSQLLGRRPKMLKYLHS